MQRLVSRQQHRCQCSSSQQAASEVEGMGSLRNKVRRGASLRAVGWGALHVGAAQPVRKSPAWLLAGLQHAPRYLTSCHTLQCTYHAISIAATTLGG